eukprot:CAMPEP_0202444820 /NCGR_PEP_ID=MMETSP1360-20130828/3760_1 /ASSEMBLY_ACC=CAM_ASM_000848 /TAXON_ID=515479 /ORGANISM="Licmophora paradoxa, Strain CCMP2313" /LENGTH=117 /DNA_ID=CAMNT_0049060893 /DNA_START=205 /DNA_END=558 /DNA_ORIENTATION=-
MIVYTIGGGPTLETSILSMMKGNKANRREPIIMKGKAIYSPISNPSVLFAGVGTTPPREAALISSSLASHEAIFSSKDILFSAVGVSPETGASTDSDSASAINILEREIFVDLLGPT